MALNRINYLPRSHPILTGSILHCDAYLLLNAPHYYLLLDWTRGGYERVALDGYVITPTNLIPVWDASTITGSLQYWTPLNNKVMARVHKQVIAQCRLARQVISGIHRTVLLAHYIDVTDPHALTAQNYYRGGNYRGRVKTLKQLPDIL